MLVWLLAAYTALVSDIPTRSLKQRKLNYMSLFVFAPTYFGKVQMVN